jgi:CHASE2 domain-containing sensor protein
MNERILGGAKSLLARALNAVPHAWRERLHEHNRENPYHWHVAAVLATAGLLAGDWLSHNPTALRMRYRAYQTLNQRAAPYTRSNDIVLVLIGDEEYWRGELARRIPIDRSYLAELVRKIGAVGPRVLALDFDLRPETRRLRELEHPQYSVETRKLAKAIHDVLETCRCTIVLPRNLIKTEEGDYVPQIDALDAAKVDRHVLRGYILPLEDIRKVPMRLPLRTGLAAESFATAIAGAINQNAVEDARRNQHSLPYARFRGAKFFPRMSAADAMRAPDTLAHKIVIIGAAWSRYAYADGEPVDTHLTPVGRIAGAMVHANYVEAMLGRETTRPMPEWAAIVIDGALSAVAALLFVIVSRRRRFTSIVAVNLCAFVLVMLIWHNFGVYFDIVVPMLLLGSHVIIEQVIEWRDRSDKHLKCEHAVASQEVTS